jgi:F-type H+-transporting ATPase subunit delta
MKSLSQCARPYAKAAFEFAQANQSIGRWQASLQVLAEVMQHADIKKFVQNPNLTHEQILTILIEALGAGAAQDVQHFLQALEDKNRLIALPQVYEWFQYYARHADHILPVTITSTEPLSSEMQQKMIAALSKRFAQTLLAEWKVDVALIGGAVIRAGDQVIDGSVRSKLGRLRDELKG